MLRASSTTFFCRALSIGLTMRFRPSLLTKLTIGLATILWYSATTAWAVQGNKPPGVVIAKSPDFKDIYVHTPSIEILPNGDYVVAFGYWGPKAKVNVTHIHRSRDKGNTWEEISQVDSIGWATLFYHNKALYLFGTRGTPGRAQIRKSTDGGVTWNSSNNSTLLDDRVYRTQPVPVSFHKGRVWREMTSVGKDKLERICIFSAPVDSDLGNPANWTCSPKAILMPLDHLGGQRDRLKLGSILENEDGKLFCLTRCDSKMSEKAALLPISDDGKTVRFDPDNSIINFPGGKGKFTIRYDEKSKRHWAVVNKMLDPYANLNVLTLTSSENLRDWKVHTELLRHRDVIWHGFGFTDWRIEGKSLVVVSQTAWDGSRGVLKSNYITFHRFKNFRSLNESDSANWRGPENDFDHETDEIKISGKNVWLSTLQPDCNVFFGWQVRLEEIPEQFVGWSFTKTKGGTLAEINVTAKRDTTIYIVTIPGGDMVDVSGWKAELIDGFRQSGAKGTPQAVFSKRLRRGQTVSVPQGNWSGSYLIFKPK